MIRYKILENSQPKFMWDNSTGDETYWEPAFGKKAGEYLINELTELELSSEITRRTDEMGNILISIPNQYEVVIEDLTTQIEIENQKQAKIEAGRKAREACQNVLDYIAGANLDKQLSIEQITQMQSTYANAEAALRAGRPTYAKMFIESIVPDGVIVTAQEKSNCLDMLVDY